jgi:chromatin structure-remodeling complex subunit RSC9
MYEHILIAPASAHKNEEGKFVNEEGTFSCHWNGCHKFDATSPMKLLQFGNHIKIHVTAQAAAHTTALAKEPHVNGFFDGIPAKKLKPSWVEPAVKRTWHFVETPVDERGDAAGIPLTAVLVLRNLARNLPKTEAEEVAMKEEGAVSYVDKLFKPVEGRLWEVFANNKSLVSQLFAHIVKV